MGREQHRYDPGKDAGSAQTITTASLEKWKLQQRMNAMLIVVIWPRTGTFEPFGKSFAVA